MQLNSIPKSSVGKRLKFRNVKGIKYVYYKTYSERQLAVDEMEKLKLYLGRKSIVYNYYRKRSFIVFVEAGVSKI